MSTLLQLAAASLDQSGDRKVTGLLVPYGKAGYSGMGVVTFAKGSIELPAEIGRVKLLSQHNVDKPLGYATAVREESDGLYVDFEVAPGSAGDAALAELAAGQRDGLSAGVRLSDEAVEAMWDAVLSGSSEPTPAGGLLLEGSLVTIPAFEDARAEGSAAYTLTAASAADQTLAVLSWGAESGTTKKENLVDPIVPVAPTAEAAAPVAPAPVPAVIAPVVVTAEAPVYTFNGQGPSLVRDLYNGQMRQDSVAQERVQRFNAALAAQDPNAHRVLTAAVETRATEPGFISSPTYRPDLLINAIDRGRPIISRLNTTPLSDATPFLIPIEPNFESVGDHVEGTAHFGEGTLTTIGNKVVTPGAVSGAYRLSRELIDASNPAIDQIALNAMLRDYRRATEAKVVAAIAAQGGAITYAIDTVLELREQLNQFQDREDIPADLVLASTGFFGELLTDVDTTGRPQLPFVGPANAVGTVAPGYTGANVDGVEIVKASTVATNTAVILQADAILYGESPVQTFRFEEVEGPGIVKLALFGYVAAAVLRPTGVKRLSAAASA